MKLAGEWMRAVRVSTGLSQQQLLSQFSKRATVFISDMEAGKIRLTPPYYEHWARAVGLEPRQVAQVMIGFHTPFLYEPLFGEPFDPARVVAAAPPPFDNSRMAEGIRRLRVEAGASQGEMAKLLGISTQSYVTYEDGSRRVPQEHLELIAKRFGVKVADLPVPGEAREAGPADEGARA